jgi:mannose-6-phosphate isomerase-like protein (cupin superfamily)
MPNPAYQPFVRPQQEWTPYTQPEPPGASFLRVLDQDEVPGLTLGHVTLNGPIHKTPATHDDWEQVYLILSGSGTVHLGGTSRKISGPGVIVIPRHTLHSVELAAGESLKYVYINQHR